MMENDGINDDINDGDMGVSQVMGLPHPLSLDGFLRENLNLR